MANTKTNDIYNASIRADIKFAEVFTYNGKQAIKGKMVTKKKDKDGNWIDGEVPFTCWASTFRKANGDEFVDVEIQQNVVYTVDLVGVDIVEKSYTNKAGEPVVQKSASCSLKPTIVKEYELKSGEGKSTSKPAAKPAPAEDDIPF